MKFFLCKSKKRNRQEERIVNCSEIFVAKTTICSSFLDPHGGGPLTLEKYFLVTEKDAARLKNSPLVPESWKKYLYYLPIVIRFYNEQSFNETIKKHIITFPKNNILQNKYE